MVVMPGEPGGQPEPRSRPCAAARRRILPLLRLRPCWCPWPMLQPEAMLMLVVSQCCHHVATRRCAATRSHAVTRSLVMLHSAVGSHWNKVGGLRSVISAAIRNHVEVHDPLLPAAMDKEPSFAVVLISEDSWLRMRDAEGFCDNFLSPAPSLSRNSLDRTLS